MAGLDALLNPVAKTPTVDPVHVTGPEDLQARVSGWQNFLTQLQTDPVMQRAALHAATQLSQGPGSGQSTLGHLAQSLEGGVQAYDMGKQNQADQATADAKTKFEQELKTSAEARAAALQPATLDKTKAEAERARAQAANEGSNQALQRRLTLAEIAVHNKTAKTSDALQAQFDLIKKTTAGAKLKDTEIWDAVHAGQKNANAGVEQQHRHTVIQTLANSADREDNNLAAQMAREDASKLGYGGAGAQTPEVTTSEEVAKLAPGTQYTYQGKTYTRGGK